MGETAASGSGLAGALRDVQAVAPNAQRHANTMAAKTRMKHLRDPSPVSFRRRFFVACILLAALAFAFVFRPLALPPHGGRALEFTDRNGQWLGTLLGSDAAHAAFVPLSRIAPDFALAVLAAEDARFAQHGAVDPQALARALADALRERRAPGGASTISMQLARMLEPPQPGWRGKVAETVGAMRLESGNSKRAILEAYCNRAPMGANLYGVEAASLAYFGIHAEALDLAQAALLAALPNDPVRLDPYVHPAAALARRRYVLERMAAQGFIAASDAERAALENVALQPRGAGIRAAAHFLFHVAPAVPEGTTVVRTTIDLPLQRFVEAQLRDVVRALGDHDVHQGAAIVVDNHTREILAYAGSVDYFDDAVLGRNDGVQALRQPGSTLKPFLYELALERRAVRPTTVLLDAPAAYAIPGGRLYEPGDYSGRFMGPVRVRIALADSLNVPAVRVLDRVGVRAFLDRLRNLGFADLRKPPEYYGLGLTLGAGEVSLYQLARAYVAAARGGVPGDLRATLTDGEIPLQAASNGDPAWAVVTDMLADKHARAAAFGVDSVLALPFPAAVKTGTSSGFRDTWTVGFTRDYTVAVWTGNFDGAPMRHVSGVAGAAPLWNRIMLHLHEHREPGAFAPPPGYTRTPICAETGERPAPACRAVVGEWLDADDLAAYRRPGAAGGAVGPLALAFPHDGDRFVLFSNGGAQRIDVDVRSRGRAAIRVAVDGAALAPVDGAYVWPLRLGPHEIVASSGSARVAARIDVVSPPRPAHAGFEPIGR